MSVPGGNYQPKIVSDDDTTFNEPVSEIREGSGLDQLKSILDKEIKLDSYSYPIPRRKTIRLILNPNIDGEAFQRWQRNAIIGKARGPESQVDSIKLAGVVIANCTEGIEVQNNQGEYIEVRDSNGVSLTFRNPELRNMLVGDNQAPSAVALVRKLFGSDGHMLECSGDLMEKAGYGDEVEEGTADDPLE